MALTPKLPPGRSNRKALQFTADIHRLRQAGYPFSAILQALRDAGLSVSLSTVKREAARKDAGAASSEPLSASAGYTPHAAARTQPIPTAASAITPAPLPSAAQPVPRSAKDEAEAFARTQITNPLARAKEPS
ncbi:hypothetical protein PEC18_29440 [Paucibacter sp. O1-1]|nr:hypothetical protein [Paucibacter sp. O1-1]MDA3829865.1 hypothetical protein [Paucibacter sp. O1-1]